MVVPLVHQAPDTPRLPLDLVTVVAILQVIPGLDVALHQVRELVVALLVRILGSVLKMVHNYVSEPIKCTIYRHEGVKREVLWSRKSSAHFE